MSTAPEPTLVRFVFGKMAGIGGLSLSLLIVWCCIMNVEHPRSPFVWRDVALIHLTCTLLFSTVLLRLMAADAGWIRLSIIAGTCWVAGVFAFAGLIGIVPVMSLPGSAPGGYFQRQIVALMLIAPLAWIGGRLGTTRVRPHAEQVAWLCLTFVIANAIPGVYVTARCHQDVTRFRELLGQSRLGEGLRLGQRLVRLDPDARWDNGTLSGTVSDLDRVVQTLQSEDSVNAGYKRTEEQWFQHAQRLAMLGQTDEALRILNEFEHPTAKTWNLAGTIHETRDSWRQGLDAYRKAEAAWESRSVSSDRSQGLIRAVTGMAFCQRKLGQYHQAESAYRKLLQLAPNADTHFLLAQFYDDSEQTVLSQGHARRAMELSPQRYLKSGKQLLDKLATSHWGCFKIWPGHSFRSASTSRYR